MYKCKECGWQGEPVNHNNRGDRCPGCWSLEVEQVEVKPEPAPKTKPPTKQSTKDRLPKSPPRRKPRSK